MIYLKISQKVLIKYYKNIDNNLKLILQNELLNSRSNENSKITNIVYNVVRKEKLLDYIISQLSKIKINKIETETLLLLKTGLCLIFFLDSIPEYAIVNEIVNLSKKRSKNFINAILRNALRQKNKLLINIENLDNTIKYSISQEIINNIGLLSDDIEYFLIYLNKEPVFHILESNCNKKKKNNKILETLRFISPINTYEILKPDKIIKSHLKNGNLYIQNTGSQLISIIASIFAKEKVLDCCAAPGTKSISLKNLSNNLKIIANDISFKRINLFNKNFTPEIQLTASDILQNTFKDSFDLILLDAPCSSAGTLRKNPDLKTKVTESVINKNTKIQENILNTILNEFNSNYILYSVCSFIKSETEDIIESSIKSRKNINVIDLSEILNKYKFTYKKGKYGCFLLPDYTLNNDLFYIALIKVT